MPPVPKEEVDAAQAKLVADLRAQASHAQAAMLEHQEAAKALQRERAELVGRAASAEAKAAEAMDAARAEALKINTDLAGALMSAKLDIHHHHSRAVRPPHALLRTCL